MPQPPIERRGTMFVLSSPSGAGKTTISRLMLERDKRLTISISATTRPPRPGEVDGKDYHFMSKEKFADMIMNEEFLEHAKVFDNYYGTPRKDAEEALNSGMDVLFDIDWQGTRQLRRNVPEDLVSVFILPPSIKELEVRLKKRAQDSDEVVHERMEKSAIEISHWNEYDYVVVNYDIETTMNMVMSVLWAERMKRERRHGLKKFVQGLMEEFNNRP